MTTQMDGFNHSSLGKRVLWRRWVSANALSEAVGLGLTFILTGLLFARLDSVPGAAAVLLSFAGAVAAGAIEATLVGLAQWWAMRPWFPSIKRFAWWRATLIGALLAYVLGYLPPTIMSLGQTPGGAAQSEEPSQALTLVLAAGLGLAAGAILSFAQYLVLRRTVARAGLWIPANMLAWAGGMPLIFWAIDVAYELPRMWQSISLVGGVLLLVGALAGAIHGIALVKLAD